MNPNRQKKLSPILATITVLTICLLFGCQSSLNSTVVCQDVDGDGYDNEACGGQDCNDSDPRVNPSETDICGDGIDQNCSGEDSTCLECEDADGDGYASSECGGYDCDDALSSVYPGAPEVCGDGIDQNCDDLDESCASCEDADGDGYTDEACGGSDCDDNDAAIHPDAVEIYDDGIDQNCNEFDDTSPECADRDSDGFSDIDCGGTDCDDANPAINPGADEICGDGIDQNCDDLDETCPPCADGDGDGYTNDACGGLDCDDADATIHPGAEDVCEDGIDQDCVGGDRTCACADSDGDGFAAATCGGSDCDDTNASVHPGAIERCNGLNDDCNEMTPDGNDESWYLSPCDGADSDLCLEGNYLCISGLQRCSDATSSTPEVCDGSDNDCDGDIDEGFDMDGDGVSSCMGDCDDSESAVRPGAVEICDDLDNDCDFTIDEGFDIDLDGWTSCGGDCNDSDPAINPGALESCDGIDNDCDFIIDNETFLPSSYDSIEYIPSGYLGLSDSVLITWDDQAALWDATLGTVIAVMSLEEIWDGLSLSGTQPPTTGIDSLLIAPSGMFGLTTDAFIVTAGSFLYWWDQTSPTWTRDSIASIFGNSSLTHVDAMTVIRSGDISGMTEDLLVVQSGSNTWLFSETNSWEGPYSNEIWCTPGTTDPTLCPPGVSSLMRLPSSPVSLLASYGTSSYLTEVLLDSTSGALYYSWAMSDMGEVSCQSSL